MQLPHHIERQGPTSRFSGEHALGVDLDETSSALLQAVADASALAAALRAEGASAVGLWGMSLGGWVSSLVAASDPSIDFCVLMMPAIDPADVLWNTNMCLPMREALVQKGRTFEETERMLAPVTPWRLRPLIDRSRILILEAAADQGIRARTIDRFWESWGRPQRIVFPHGHLTLAVSLEARRAAKRFIVEKTRPGSQPALEAASPASPSDR